MLVFATRKELLAKTRLDDDDERIGKLLSFKI